MVEVDLFPVAPIRYLGFIAVGDGGDPGEFIDVVSPEPPRVPLAVKLLMVLKADGSGAFLDFPHILQCPVPEQRMSFNLIELLFRQVRLFMDDVRRKLHHPRIDKEGAEAELSELDLVILERDPGYERIKGYIDGMGQGVVLSLVEAVQKQKNVAVLFKEFNDILDRFLKIPGLERGIVADGLISGVDGGAGPA